MVAVQMTVKCNCTKEITVPYGKVLYSQLKEVVAASLPPGYDNDITRTVLQVIVDRDPAIMHNLYDPPREALSAVAVCLSRTSGLTREQRGQGRLKLAER